MESMSMINNISSSMNKPIASLVKEATTDSRKEEEEEESGWTAYFEDFSYNNHRREEEEEEEEEEKEEEDGFSSCSLVSDAASGAAWKISQHNNHLFPCSKTPRNLRFKKTRTEEISGDDSLEDTASSPVNSPKVSDLEEIDMYQKKADIHMNSSLGKEDMSTNINIDRSTMNFDEKTDCTELKRRGLCLVPVSMLVNYLG